MRRRRRLAVAIAAAVVFVLGVGGRVHGLQEEQQRSSQTSKEPCACPRHCNVSISIQWSDVLGPGQSEQLQELRHRLTSAALRIHNWNLGDADVEADALVFNKDKGADICARLEEQIRGRVEAVLGPTRDARVNVRPTSVRRKREAVIGSDGYPRFVDQGLVSGFASSVNRLNVSKFSAQPLSDRTARELGGGGPDDDGPDRQLTKKATLGALAVGLIVVGVTLAACLAGVVVLVARRLCCPTSGRKHVTSGPLVVANFYSPAMAVPLYPSHVTAVPAAAIYHPPSGRFRTHTSRSW